MSLFQKKKKWSIPLTQLLGGQCPDEFSSNPKQNTPESRFSKMTSNQRQVSYIGIDTKACRTLALMD